MNPPFTSPPWPFPNYAYPPPTSPQQTSDPNFSPLVIALIGILASAFLLVSYYTIIAKYCTNWESFRRRVQGDYEDDSYHQQPPPPESWALVTRGLEESVIKSIPICKYKRGDGLVEDTECAVCLSEFQDDESLRLLPKCTHAFHLPCIDMWLSSHSNCPLCRANIVNPVTSPPTVVVETIHEENTESTVDSQSQSPLEADAERENLSHEEPEQGMVLDVPAALPASHLRALSDLVSKHGRSGSLSQSRKLFFSAEAQQPIRRSFSVDSSRRLCVSITDLLAMYPDLEDGKSKPFGGVDEAGACASSSAHLEDGKQKAFSNVVEAALGASSSIQSSTVIEEHQLAIEMSSVSLKSLNKQLCGDKNKSTMRRSFSGGRFLFFKNNRGRNATVLPT
eukprot:Gb_20461 [translate_table: standard]